MDFKDFFELVVKMVEYKKLLREESQRKGMSIGTYL